MDRRTLLAISLCFLIYMGWEKFYIEPRIPHTNVAQLTNQSGEQKTAPAASAANPSGTEQTAQAPETAARHAAQSMTLATNTGPAKVGDGDHFFTGWDLNHYHTTISDSSPAIDLPSVTHQDSELELAFDDPAYAYLSKVQGTLHRTASGVEWSYEDRNIKLTRLFASEGSNKYVSLQLTAQFKRKRPKYAFVSLSMPYVKGDFDERDRELVYGDGSIERVSPKSASLKETTTPVKYIGTNSRYFLMAVLNNGPMAPNALIQPLGEQKARASLVYPVTGDTLQIPLKVFFGPKEVGVLRSVDPALAQSINFGWFAFFAWPLLRVLKFFYNFVGNYGWAIILLTIVLRLLTYPLTYKSMKSMKEMAKIQPQLAKLREKYKNDKDTLNREMLTLMKTHGYNPAAGCLPMVVQIPIFFALDRVLYGSIDLYHAPFALYLHDLSAKDPYYITPVLLSISMWLQQKLSPTNATIDPAQQKMMQFMPLIFGAFMLNLPSGLNLYILVSTIVGVGQQFVLNKKFNTGPGSNNAPALVVRNV